MNTKRFLNAWNNFKIDWKKSLWSKLHIWFLLFLLSLCFRLTLNIHVTRMLQQNQFSCERFLFGNWISVKSVQIIFLIYIFFLFVLDHTRWNETFKRQNESTHFWDMISMLSFYVTSELSWQLVWRMNPIEMLHRLPVEQPISSYCIVTFFIFNLEFCQELTCTYIVISVSSFIKAIRKPK